MITSSTATWKTDAESDPKFQTHLSPSTQVRILHGPESRVCISRTISKYWISHHVEETWKITSICFRQSRLIVHLPNGNQIASSWMNDDEGIDLNKLIAKDARFALLQEKELFQGSLIETNIKAISYDIPSPLASSILFFAAFLLLSSTIFLIGPIAMLKIYKSLRNKYTSLYFQTTANSSTHSNSFIQISPIPSIILKITAMVLRWIMHRPHFGVFYAAAPFFMWMFHSFFIP